MIRMILVAVLALLPTIGFAAVDNYEFDSAAQQALFKELADELRCPKCQNQNIADSNAPIAKDLRNKVHKLVVEGQDKGEIVDFMVERYGYFVYYKPPVTAGTIVLWVLPIAFVLFTLVLIWLKARRSQKLQIGEAGQWSEADEAELNDLIDSATGQKGAAS